MIVLVVLVKGVDSHARVAAHGALKPALLDATRGRGLLGGYWVRFLLVGPTQAVILPADGGVMKELDDVHGLVGAGLALERVPDAMSFVKVKIQVLLDGSSIITVITGEGLDFACLRSRTFRNFFHCCHFLSVLYLSFTYLVIFLCEKHDTID